MIDPCRSIHVEDSRRTADGLLGVVMGLLVGNLPQQLAKKLKEFAKGLRELIRKLIRKLLEKMKKIFGRRGVQGKTDAEGYAPACPSITIRNSSTKKKPPRRESCFPAGTIVDNGRSRQPIETFEREQPVVALDQKTGKWRSDTVAQTFEREYTGLIVTLSIAGETLRTTARHPFWVVSGDDLADRPITEELGTDNTPRPITGRWVEAQYLRKTDVLLSRHKGEIPVQEVSISEETITVYNLQITDCQTYAVAECGVLVHNASPPEEGDVTCLFSNCQEAFTYTQVPECPSNPTTSSEPHESCKECNPNCPDCKGFDRTATNRDYFAKRPTAEHWNCAPRGDRSLWRRGGVDHVSIVCGLCCEEREQLVLFVRKCLCQ